MAIVHACFINRKQCQSNCNPAAHGNSFNFITFQLLYMHVEKTVTEGQLLHLQLVFLHMVLYKNIHTHSYSTKEPSEDPEEGECDHSEGNKVEEEDEGKDGRVQSHPRQQVAPGDNTSACIIRICKQIRQELKTES